ncbi:hypothetical protein NDU88_005911 [Pleurodeles waltl]|uniref:Uncharacterized protein n=1 Tax=Pleurodeles waltl TaxID=8319 RepID=A0AAV7TCC1_PLEWA|nr:hypothetical protein NDU88_005911 [Pleurodeles waltl]
MGATGEHQELDKIAGNMGCSSCSGLEYSRLALHNQTQGEQVRGGSSSTECLLLQILSDFKALKLSQEEANRKTEAQLSLMNNNMQQLSTCVKEVEQRVSDLEDGGSHMDASIARYQAELANLQIRVDDAENRSCRSNLRFTGKPEGRESG